MPTQELGTGRNIIEIPRPNRSFFTFRHHNHTLLVNNLFALKLWGKSSHLTILVGARINVPVERESRIEKGLTAMLTDETEPKVLPIGINSNNLTNSRRIYIGANFPYRVSVKERSMALVRIMIEGVEPINLEEFERVTNLEDLIERTPII